MITSQHSSGLALEGSCGLLIGVVRPLPLSDQRTTTLQSTLPSARAFSRTKTGHLDQPLVLILTQLRKRNLRLPICSSSHHESSVRSLKTSVCCSLSVCAVQYSLWLLLSTPLSPSSTQRSSSPDSFLIASCCNCNSVLFKMTMLSQRWRDHSPCLASLLEMTSCGWYGPSSGALASLSLSSAGKSVVTVRAGRSRYGFRSLRS
jgi:hypothetical protein